MDNFRFPCIFTWNDRRKNAEQFFLRCVTSRTEVRPTLNFTHSSLFLLSNLIPSKCCHTKHNFFFVKGVNKLCNTAQFSVLIKIQRKYFINMVTNIVFNSIKCQIFLRFSSFLNCNSWISSGMNLAAFVEESWIEGFHWAVQRDIQENRVCWTYYAVLYWPFL
jgi:hypothetical protein